MHRFASRLVGAAMFDRAITASTGGTRHARSVWHGFVAADAPNVRGAPSTAAPIVGTVVNVYD